jgi:phosphatidylglycerol---prolipoprotein diacylglyceryl transferase
MLDIMAVVTCLVHGMGRIGCLMAGCCYGKPTVHAFGMTFTNPVCQANPLNVALHPTQIYEATLIFSLMAVLLFLRSRKRFDGQLFLIYLIGYAVGRGVLEMFRGDLQRGFLIKDILSHSQFISVLIIGVAMFVYVKWNRSGTFGSSKH